MNFHGDDNSRMYGRMALVLLLTRGIFCGAVVFSASALPIDVKVLNLFNVRDAAIYADDTLDLDWNVQANRSRYSNSIDVLNRISTNKREVY